MTTIDAARMPTSADEDRYWALLESAWAACGPDAAAARRALLERDPSTDEENESLFDLDRWLEPFLEQLRRSCADMSSEELTDLDRVVERKLFDIDREEIHARTDGSDDGFLYCRGFIVAAGREFYEAVNADPAMAVMDAECESMCYLFAHLHDKRFGAYPETESGISRESGRNVRGWEPSPSER